MPVRVAELVDIEAMHRIRLAVRENVLSDPTKVQPKDYVDYLQQRGRGWVFEVDGVSAACGRCLSVRPTKVEVSADSCTTRC